MKKYTLTILINGFPSHTEQIQGETLIELMSRLLITIARLAELEKKLPQDDDIPF